MTYRITARMVGEHADVRETRYAQTEETAERIASDMRKKARLEVMITLLPKLSDRQRREMDERRTEKRLLAQRWDRCTEVFEVEFSDKSVQSMFATKLIHLPLIVAVCAGLGVEAYLFDPENSPEDGGREVGYCNQWGAVRWR